LSRLPPGLADHGILAAHRIQEGVDHILDQDGRASQIGTPEVTRIR
jgi:hypothetical protein